MYFWKMNGTGNDFLLINNMEEHLSPEIFPTLARTLCHRQFSIGADGLMIVDTPVQGGDYRMWFYNNDGSTSEMCGNGARCICRYGYENGLAGEVQRVETTAGLVIGQRIDKRLYRIRLNDPADIRLDIPIEANGVCYTGSYMELGDPGIPLYGAALREDTLDARQADYSRCAIAIGSEGRGLTEGVLALCDRTIKIPMSEHCESLNAAAAATVLLWEAARND